MDKNAPIILPTAYLPPVEYFALLINSDAIVIEQYETYSKQTYRNRCEIYTEKGKMPLIIPVSKPSGNHTKTSDIRIFNQDKWYVKHWRAIETAYKAAPFFLYYSNEINSFYNGTIHKLLNFNLELTKLLCQLIGIETELKLSDDYVNRADTRIDYREELSPKKPNILKSFPEYTQVFSTKHGFIPNLSIIDLLFNLGPESFDYLTELDKQLNIEN